MKTIHTLFLAAALLGASWLPLTACATPPATPSGASWGVPHFTFEPMSAEKQAELRHAFTNCAKVEMCIEWYDEEYRICGDKRWRLVRRIECDGKDIWKRIEWVRTLTKGAELGAILNKLSAVPKWYTPIFDKQLRYTPGAMYTIRFLNAEGEVLLSEENAFGPWISCMNEQGERVCLSAFFPAFPDMKCFGK